MYAAELQINKLFTIFAQWYSLSSHFQLNPGSNEICTT